MRNGLLILTALLTAAGCGRRSISVETESAAASSVAEEAVPEAGGGFRFADDSGGKLLGRLLPPGERLPPHEAELPSGPRAFPVPPALQPPDVLPPPLPTDPPKSAVGRKSSPARPRPLPEEVPLAGNRG